jgi:hypothetical protein
MRDGIDDVPGEGMKRRLFTFLSALSLLFCVAICALWFRSMGTMDIVSHGTVDQRDNTVHVMLLMSDRGIVTFHPIRETFADAPSLALRLGTVKSWPAYEWQCLAARPWWPLGVGWMNHLGFRYRQFDGTSTLIPRRAGVSPVAVTIACAKTERMITIPYWLPSLLGAALPAWWAIARIRRARRVGEGCCTACGYDLTGNVSGACPECGGKVL